MNNLAEIVYFACISIAFLDLECKYLFVEYLDEYVINKQNKLLQLQTL